MYMHRLYDADYFLLWRVRKLTNALAHCIRHCYYRSVPQIYCGERRKHDDNHDDQ